MTRAADDRRPDHSLRIAQISDLHFGPPFLGEVADRLAVTVGELAIDALVVSGDLTQRATRRQFEDARDYLDRFGDTPRIVVPGNHDVPLYRVGERLRDPRRLYRQIITEDLSPTLRLDGAFFVGIDSTAPREAISNGRIRAKQLQNCAASFEQAEPEDARIVVTHHHLVQAPDALRDQTLRGSRRALRCFVECGVDVVFAGHLHRGFIGSSLDFLRSGGGRDRGVIVVQCGTSTSARGRGRERERNTFNLVDIGSETLTVTHYLHHEESQAFLPSSRHLFPRGRNVLL